MKDVIISFLKEAIYHDDPFLRHNANNKSLRVDFKFEKNRNTPQILIDNFHEMECNRLVSSMIREENKILDVDMLVTCRMKEFVKKN